MGVAGLFSFLRRRYPEIVEACAQQGHEVAEGETACDCLYIDLNHIIHACTHPSWREEAHEGELEQFMEVDIYLDRLVALMRPTRLLLVAADGSAPTAKMNQQRGRRFYAAHLERQRQEIERQVRREMAAEMGPVGGAEIPALPAFDGNVITPGTSFMARLSNHLREFFSQKLESDPEWAHLAVIFSDSSEPGEGEHKILRFIRQQRTQPDYDPNTRHAIYGQDADLILLGLLSHEPHFCLLRESGTLEAALEGGADEPGADAMWSPVGQQPLELLRLSTLRDFLRCEFAEFCASQEGSTGRRPPPPPPQQQQQQTVLVDEPFDAAGPVGADGASAAPSNSASGSPGSGSGSSQRSSSEGEGLEVDLITAQPKRVHPSVARRQARKQQRAAAQDTIPSSDGSGFAAGMGGSDGEAHGSSGSSGSAAGSSGHASSSRGGGGSHSFERILDDVVFCTFLAGNDFLPHIPSLDIYDRPSALETLLDKYKEMLRGGSGRRGYLTNSGRVDGDKLCWLFQRLGAEEEATFQQREIRKVREQRRRLHQEASAGGGSDAHNRPAGASWMGGREWVSVGELAPGESLEEMLAAVASSGYAEVPTAALYAHDPARLRRELLRRIRSRMDDRAQAGMAADPVRLSIAGYRGRYYQRCFGAEAPGGPELEKLVRRVCAAFCRTLCWVMQYYVRGCPPVPPPGWGSGDGATGPEAGSPCSSTASRRRISSHGGGNSSSSDTAPYASWQVHYEWHYAPLASDLSKYGREAMRGAAAAASHSDAPIPPFAQLLSVLPFSSMPACLPAALVTAAVDPHEGLVALHGTEGPQVFPEDVSSLVDLSGKKWAHTAVVTLPFPDMQAITQFVREQLDEDQEEGGASKLSAEERARNSFAPALLYLSAFHPLAQHALQRVAKGQVPCASTATSAALAEGVGGAGAAAEDREGAGCAGEVLEGQPTVVEGSSILSLLLPAQQQGAGEASLLPDQQPVLCLPLDIAGQDTPPFSPGLLPGTEEGEPSVTLQAWNKRKQDALRKQAQRAAAGLRGGRGRGRDTAGRSSGAGRGRGSARGGSTFMGQPPRAYGSGSSGGSPFTAPVIGLSQPPLPSAQRHAVLAKLQSPAAAVQPTSRRQQQELSDEEMARRLQEQFDAEARAEQLAASSSSSGMGSTASNLPQAPAYGAAEASRGGEDGWGGGMWGEEAAAHPFSPEAPWLALGQGEEQGEGEGDGLADEEVVPGLVGIPALAAHVHAATAAAARGPTDSPQAPLPFSLSAAAPATYDSAQLVLASSPQSAAAAAPLPPGLPAAVRAPPPPAAAPAAPAAAAAEPGQSGDELDDMLALLGIGAG